MKLNQEIFRNVLITISQINPENDLAFEDLSKKYRNQFEFIKDAELREHLRYALEGKYIKGTDDMTMDEGTDVICGLTFKGDQFLANILDNEVWMETRAVLSKVNHQTSLDVVKEIAGKVIREKLERF